MQTKEIQIEGDPIRSNRRDSIPDETGCRTPTVDGCETWSTFAQVDGNYLQENVGLNHFARVK